MEIDQIKLEVRGHDAELIREAPVMRASVLIPLVERGGVTCVLFEERNRNIPQGGEICFPGGQLEENEAPAETAVRETAEELLLRREQIEVLAPLHRLEASGSRTIDSFLGILHGYEDTWAPDEVARTFLLPLKQFIDTPPEVYKGRSKVIPGGDFPYELIPGGRDYRFASSPQKFYFYRTDFGVIWGLTAKLLYHFTELLRPSAQTRGSSDG